MEPADLATNDDEESLSFDDIDSGNVWSYHNILSFLSIFIDYLLSLSILSHQKDRSKFVSTYI